MKIKFFATQMIFNLSNDVEAREQQEEEEKAERMMN
jgi:hypothetical protein